MQLRSQLASVPVSQSVKDDAEEAYRSYLGSVWSDDAMFFNYLEQGLQFAAVCCDVVAAGKLLTNKGNVVNIACSSSCHDCTRYSERRISSIHEFVQAMIMRYFKCLN